MNRTKFERQREFEMINNSTKEERDKFLLEYKKNNFMSFNSVFIDSIGQRNKKLLIDFMEYLAFSPMAKMTCRNIKTNLILFFKWNRDYNNNVSFRAVTKKQGESFFLFIKENDYSYRRAKCIKADICTLANFCQHVLGKDEYHPNGTMNQWFSYTHEWKDVDIQQEELGFKKSNTHTFDTKKLEPLRFYLQEQNDYVGLIILHFCDLREKILTLQESDVDKDSPLMQKYLQWKEEIGAAHMTNILFTKLPDGTYAPMTLAELRRYAKMFSVFLCKEFIIC